MIVAMERRQQHRTYTLKIFQKRVVDVNTDDNNKYTMSSCITSSMCGEGTLYGYWIFRRADNVAFADMINRTMTVLFESFFFHARSSVHSSLQRKKLIFSRLLLIFVRLNYSLLASLLWQEIAKSMRTTATALFFFHFSYSSSVHMLLVIRCERRTHLPSETPTHCVTCSGQSFFNFFCAQIFHP